ncbi:tetratricopeptide repeat protein [Flavobacterium sp. IMCC34852]|uniref:Tetratricopeptide repeat protein n=1 Tax=Flavobacterium rivulicola TaxID=2732161 RepID=A0A7Y3R9H0_9FLAO|nr:tetratricopeptide repeat protein [Flavobacterium sp. IMCC34852]NNT72353.1 tetratricopeptide repeat protein [Flavobacterium sp. IMCC34852]
MKKILLITTFLCCCHTFSQRNEIAWNKAKEAIKLMDEGKIDESIVILQECEKMDDQDYTYPYEIAYAYQLKKDYAAAIAILDKTKNYKNSNSQVYQLSGNCYSYLGKPDLAIKEYEDGMKKFPKAANLHLEKGNIFLHQKKYNEAIENYEAGIKADPMFPSNYYRLALLYLDSNDKLSGLIYGEIFLNLERTTKRTKEMSKLLFDTYKSSIVFNGNETKIDFCDVIIDDKHLKRKEIRMPFCAIFGSNFILSTLGQNDINLESLSKIRTAFLQHYFKSDYKKYPNVLLAYHKKMLDDGHFETYNNYIFQMGAQNEFADWKNNHKEDYENFVTWYTTEKNIIAIHQKNIFIKE